MKIEKTDIEGLVVIHPRVFEDARGYFFESFNKRNFEAHNLPCNFVQDNEAFSSFGVLRGMHYQLPPAAQTKLVRVVRGKVLDVVVDIRENSKTYGKSYSIVLSAKNKKQLLIPKGFAHGYLTLSKRAVFCYKCDSYYSKEHEGGIIWNDPSIKIDWNLTQDSPKLSDKDKDLPFFGDHKKFQL